jgi:hypothetical protein
VLAFKIAEIRAGKFFIVLEPSKNADADVQIRAGDEIESLFVPPQKIGNDEINFILVRLRKIIVMQNEPAQTVTLKNRLARFRQKRKRKQKRENKTQPVFHTSTITEFLRTKSCGADVTKFHEPS